VTIYVVKSCVRRRTFVAGSAVYVSGPPLAAGVWFAGVTHVWVSTSQQRVGGEQTCELTIINFI